MAATIGIVLATACGCSDTDTKDGNSGTNGSTNGVTNGATNGSTNGSTNGATNGSTNGATNSMTNGSTNSQTNSMIGPEDCTDDEILSTRCARCGAANGCDVTENVCVAVCDPAGTGEECGDGYCDSNGACREFQCG